MNVTCSCLLVIGVQPWGLCDRKSWVPWCQVSLLLVNGSIGRWQLAWGVSDWLPASETSINKHDPAASEWVDCMIRLPASDVVAARYVSPNLMWDTNLVWVAKRKGARNPVCVWHLFFWIYFPIWAMDRRVWCCEMSHVATSTPGCAKCSTWIQQEKKVK